MKWHSWHLRFTTESVNLSKSPQFMRFLTWDYFRKGKVWNNQFHTPFVHICNLHFLHHILWISIFFSHLNDVYYNTHVLWKTYGSISQFFRSIIQFLHVWGFLYMYYFNFFFTILFIFVYYLFVCDWKLNRWWSNIRYEVYYINDILMSHFWFMHIVHSHSNRFVWNPRFLLLSLRLNWFCLLTKILLFTTVIIQDLSVRVCVNFSSSYSSVFIVNTWSLY